MAGPNHLSFHCLMPSLLQPRFPFSRGHGQSLMVPCSDHSHQQQHHLSPRRAPQSCPHKPGPGPGPGCSHPSFQSRCLAQQEG